MTMTQTQATALPETDANTVAKELQAELVELIDLSLKAKQAHWNIVGPKFRSVHLQLDEIVDDLRMWTDTIAERLSTINVYPDGRAGTVARDSGFRDMPAGEIKDTQVVETFSNYLLEFATKTRQRSERAAADPVTQNILQDVIAGTEKHQWMLRAQAK